MRAIGLGRDISPAIGRGYLAGRREIPVNAGTQANVLSVSVHRGTPKRWRIRLAVSQPTGVVFPPKQAQCLTFTATFTMEGDQIARTFKVTSGNAQVIYGTGIVAKVDVANEGVSDLWVDYAIEEGVFGLSSWEDTQVVSVATEEALKVPAYCDELNIATTAPGAILRGYNLAGVLVYSQSLTESSLHLNLIQEVAYTIEFPTGVGLIGYKCRG